MAPAVPEPCFGGDKLAISCGEFGKQGDPQVESNALEGSEVGRGSRW